MTTTDRRPPAAPPGAPPGHAQRDLERLLAQPPARSQAALTLPAGITHGRVASVLVWIGACATTYLALAALLGDAPWYVLLGTATIIQFVFTAAERPLFRRRGRDMLSFGVLLLDIGINAGGVFPALANVGRTPTAAMLQAGGMPADAGALPAILLALFVGAIIAAAPEALWQM